MSTNVQRYVEEAANEGAQVKFIYNNPYNNLNTTKYNYR